MGAGTDGLIRYLDTVLMGEHMAGNNRLLPGQHTSSHREVIIKWKLVCCTVYNELVAMRGLTQSSSRFQLFKRRLCVGLIGGSD